MLGYFHEFESSQEGMNLLLEFNYFYEMFGQKGGELIARFLDIFPNLSPEMNELIARFLAIFTEMETKKKWTYCIIFGHFHKLHGRNELIARTFRIVTNLRPDIVARKLIAVKL